MKLKFTTGLLAVLVTAPVIAVTMQQRDTAGMQQQLNAITAQSDNSAAQTVATADTTSGFSFISEADAAPLTPVETPAPAPEQNADAVTQTPAVPIEPPADGNQTKQPPIDRFNDPYSSGQWDPYREIERMQEEMDRIMDQAFTRYGIDPYYDPFYDQHYDPYYGPPRGGPGYGRHYGRGPGVPPGPDMRRGPDFRHSMRDTMTPAMDLQDKGDNYVVLVDLPGTDADNISVTLDGDRLRISARQTYDKEDKDSRGNVIFRERRSGSFVRSLSLPGPVKQSGMKTDYDKGVLRITIPKA